MVGAIVITLLAALCAAGIFAALFISRQPAEGWKQWLRSTFTAWRSDELSWTEVDPDHDHDGSEVGGLGDLYRMSEPGNAYVLPDELSSFRFPTSGGSAALTPARPRPPRGRLVRPRASHAEH